MKIIDISEHNGIINFNDVKVDGVIIRAGYGKGNIDDCFKQNIENAIAANVKNIGIYWFSYAYSVEMAVKEAIYTNEIIEPYKNKLNLGVYFDWEYDSMNYARKNGIYPNKDLITEMNREYCENIRKFGYEAGYYLNYDYERNYIDTSKLKNFRKWFAWYNPTLDEECYLWQYTNDGKIGYKTFDMNELIGNVSEPIENNDNTITEEYNMPLLRRGSSGKAVKIWQIIVGTTVDGIFGINTEISTKRFQERNNLIIDGIVGPQSWKAGLDSVSR